MINSRRPAVDGQRQAINGGSGRWQMVDGRQQEMVDGKYYIASSGKTDERQ